MLDQLCRATRAWVRWPACSTGTLGGLGPVPNAPRGEPVVPGQSGPGPSALVSTSCPRTLVLGFVGPPGVPAFPGDSGLAPKACGVYQLFRATRACIRGPAGSTSCPRTFALVSESPRCRSALPGDSGLAPQTSGSTSHSGPLALESEGPRVRPAIPGDSGPGPKAVGFDQLSRETRVLFRGPAVDQLSRTTRAHDQPPTGSTSCPGGIGPLPNGQRGPPAVLGDSGLCPRACVVV